MRPEPATARAEAAPKPQKEQTRAPRQALVSSSCAKPDLLAAPARRGLERASDMATRARRPARRELSSAMASTHARRPARRDGADRRAREPASAATVTAAPAAARAPAAAPSPRRRREPQTAVALAEPRPVSEPQAWTAIATRDASYDDAFVYAVTTTGVYCRPSCPSRRPLRENTRLFARPLEAERAGFRACRRCTPAARQEMGLTVVRALCAELRAGKVPLPELARRAGYSVAQTKRLFEQVLGLSPARFAEACRREALRHELRASDSVALAIYGAGYTTPSQVYGADFLGMPPSAFARGGAEVEISYACGDTALGALLLAATDVGVCSVELGDSPAELERSLREAFPRARLSRAAKTAPLLRWLAALEDHLAGRRPHPDLPLDVRTTAFRHRVYLALQAIPRGQTRSYQQIAEAVGQPTAARAVARACAENQVALLIPCHRVLRGDGALAGYRWGLDRKRALLAAEAAATVESGPGPSRRGARSAAPAGS